YQLALTSPGTSPRMAASRNLFRQRPNFRYTPWGRPVIRQRRCWRLGLESRGSFCSLTSASQRSSSVVAGLLMMAFSSARLAAYLATSLVRFSSRSIIDVFAISLALTSQRKVERPQQCAAFIVVPSRGGDGDIHATQLVDLVVINLGEDDLLVDPHGEIATSVEGLGADTAEITDSRDSDIDKLLQVLIHPIAAQRHLATDRPALADLEPGDGGPRLGDDRLLTGNQRQVIDRVLEDLLVGHRLTNTHVEGDLGDTRNLHGVLETEFRLQLRGDLVFVNLLQLGHVNIPC